MPETPVPPFRVLAVDDDPIVLSLVARVLGREGFSVSTAPGPVEAVALADAMPYDAVLTDLAMEVMTGLDLIRQVKVGHPTLACVLMTGAGTRDDAIQALRGGVFDYVEKPFANLAELVAVVRRAAAHTRILRERDALLVDLQRKKVELEEHLGRLSAANEELRRQRDLIDADLARAQRLQRNLLPSRFPDLGPFACAGYYRPCESLGGDSFDAFELPGGRAALLIADVAGHGVHAAMITVILHGLIRTQLRADPEARVLGDPALALAYLNRGLREERLDDPSQVTAAYAVVDPTRGEVLYSNAGHPHPLLSPGPAPSALPRGPALGILANPAYATTRLPLPEGAALVLFSDGLTDALNAERKPLGREDMEAAFASAQLGSARAARDALGGLLDHHLAGHPLPDDVTFVALFRHPPGSAEPGGPGVVTPDSRPPEAPNPAPSAGTPVLQGVAPDGSITVALQGRVSWRSAAAFASATEKGTGRVRLDLSTCEYLDSTLLGLLALRADHLVLHAPSPRLVGLADELGILGRLTIVQAPAPAVRLTEVPDPGATNRRGLVLQAHEELLRASPANEVRFGPVVEELRKDAGSP
jgi:phosphoserine phosphatase RsbU/P